MFDDDGEVFAAGDAVVARVGEAAAAELMTAICGFVSPAPRSAATVCVIQSFVFVELMESEIVATLESETDVTCATI